MVTPLVLTMNPNNDNDYDQFFPKDPVDKDNLSIEIPAEPAPVLPERIASGYEPMGEIQLRGQAFRGLAGGRTPWWVLITGWLMFGFIAAVMLHLAITASSFTAWMVLAIALIPLFILVRGTIAKWSARQDR